MKYYLLFLVVFVTLTIVCANHRTGCGNHSCNNNGPCREAENNTAVNNPTLCNGFFLCLDGTAIPGTCPPGQWFNPDTLHCDSNDADCPEDEDFECPSDEGVYFLASSESCDEYILCFGGFPIIRSCAKGLHFDPRNGFCTLPERAECKLNICPPDNDPNNLVFIPSEVDCELYYICFDGETIPQRCAPDFHWDVVYEVCNFPEIANCTANETDSTPEPFPEPHEVECPKDGIHFIPHPKSCGHYFICTNGESRLLPCADNLLFDPENEWCDFEENVVCDLDTSSEEEPETTPRPIPEPHEIDCPSDYGFFCIKHPKSCEFFFVCKNGVSTLVPCAYGQFFDPVLQWCDKKDNVRCHLDHSSEEDIEPGPPPPTTEPCPEPHETDCPSDDGFYIVEHPKSCEHFFFCIHGISVVRPCAPGLLFDPILQWCDIPENVDCPHNGNSSNEESGEYTTSRPPCPGCTPPPCPGPDCENDSGESPTTTSRPPCPGCTPPPCPGPDCEDDSGESPTTTSRPPCPGCTPPPCPGPDCEDDSGESPTTTCSGPECENDSSESSTTSRPPCPGCTPPPCPGPDCEDDSGESPTTTCSGPECENDSSESSTTSRPPCPGCTPPPCPGPDCEDDSGESPTTTCSGPECENDSSESSTTSRPPCPGCTPPPCPGPDCEDDSGESPTTTCSGPDCENGSGESSTTSRPPCPGCTPPPCPGPDCEDDSGESPTTTCSGPDCENDSAESSTTPRPPCPGCTPPPCPGPDCEDDSSESPTTTCSGPDCENDSAESSTTSRPPCPGCTPPPCPGPDCEDDSSESPTTTCSGPDCENDSAESSTTSRPPCPGCTPPPCPGPDCEDDSDETPTTTCSGPDCENDSSESSTTPRPPCPGCTPPPCPGPDCEDDSGESPTTTCSGPDCENDSGESSTTPRPPCPGCTPPPCPGPDCEDDSSESPATTSRPPCPGCTPPPCPGPDCEDDSGESLTTTSRPPCPGCTPPPCPGPDCEGDSGESPTTTSRPPCPGCTPPPCPGPDCEDDSGESPTTTSRPPCPGCTPPPCPGPDCESPTTTSRPPCPGCTPPPCPEPHEVECPKEGLHVFRHPHTCQYFFVCYYGESILLSCAPGLLFDPKNLWCDVPENVECDDEEASNSDESSTETESSEESPTNTPEPCPDPHEIECPSEEGIHTIKHPYSCEYYFVCSDGVSVLLPCAPGLLFDPINGWCDVADNVECHLNSTVDIECPSEDGLYIIGHPNDCQLYFICSGGIPILQECAPGLIFDPVNEWCDFEENIECHLDNDSSKDSDEIRCSEEGIYHLKDPLSCSNFFICANGELIPQTCAEGFYFDVANEWCDFKENVDCHLNNRHRQIAQTEQLGIECSSNDSFFKVKHPNHCDQYIICSDGNLSAANCAPGLAYDSISRRCDASHKVDCEQ